MPIYRQEIRVHATAYIRAKSEAEAHRIALDKFNPDRGAELPVGEGVEIAVSGRMFDDPRLPDVSISPAVTFGGLSGRPSDVEEG